ncbi:MAG: leucine-rich repeat protein [Clostridia bacterium]|nr:leucine-rich repeat protein [Clostridia bacterium]
MIIYESKLETCTVIGAFTDCTALETIEIPDSATSIGTQAFAGCSSLTELPLMKDATDIGYCAFLGCSSIRELIIPDSVTTVGTGAFSLCTGIETIRWGKNLTLIPSLAFHNCDSLVRLELPDHMDAIGYRAFADCDNLTTISLTTNTTVIGEGAFKDCNALTDVFYSGTKAEWDEVFIGDDNDALLNATIHFVTRLAYDANGGENAPETVNTEGEVEISTQIPTRFGYLFKGWGTDQNSWTATYQPGETIVLPDGGMTLYAVWYPIEMGARIYDDSLLVSVYNAPAGSQIVVACYSGDTLEYVDGVMTTAEQRYDIPGDFTGYDRVKVMLYDGFSTLKPLMLPVDAIDSSN